MVMLLPRGDIVLENTKVRFVDFDTLIADEFESSLKQDQSINGYVSITYPQRKDILIIFDSQIKKALSIHSRNKRAVVSLQEVINQAKKDFEGVVNYYKMPVSFIEMLWDSTVSNPVNNHLDSEFIVWTEYLNSLKQKEFLGYLEIEAGGMLGFIHFSNGDIDLEYHYQPIDLLKPFQLRLFDEPERQFISETESIRHTFLDIFKDMLQTTYSIIVQSDEVNVLLSKSLAHARKKFPLILNGVHTKKTGLIDFEVMFDNLEEIAPKEKRDQFIGSILCILEERLNLIHQEFGIDILDRTLKEMKLVQLFHQKALQRFNIAESLLTLWKMFENISENNAQN